MDEFRIGAEPGGVHAFATPDHTDGYVRITCGEDGIIHIKPVLFDGGAFGGVKEDAQVADLFLIGDGAP